MTDGAETHEPDADGTSRSGASYGLPYLLGAVALHVLDTFVLNQGVLAVLAGGLALLSMLPMIRATPARRWKIAARALPFVLCAVATNRTNQWPNEMARERATTIIAACERYHHDTGSYPEALDDLMPTYIASIPAAKWGVIGPWSEFQYSVYGDRHSLTYTAVPPFGRPYYRLEERDWRYMD